MSGRACTRRGEALCSFGPSARRAAAPLVYALRSSHIDRSPLVLSKRRMWHVRWWHVEVTCGRHVCVSVTQQLRDTESSAPCSQEQGAKPYMCMYKVVLYGCKSLNPAPRSPSHACTSRSGKARLAERLKREFSL